MFITSLRQNANLLRLQANQLALVIATNKGDEEVENTQLEVTIEDDSSDYQPATSPLVNVTDLDHRIKSLYQPQIGSMQHQIAALMTQVEQLMEQMKAKNI